MNLLKRFMLPALAGVALLSSCERDNNDDDLVVRYRDYYTTVETDRDNYNDDYWMRADARWDSFNNAIDMRKDKMDERASAQVDSLRTSYNNLKSNYKMEMEKKKMMDDQMMNSQRIYMTTFGEQVKEDASDVTAANILSRYQKLVAAAEANTETWTSAEWDAVKAYYEKLDERKNDLEKDIDGKVNREIAGLKIKFDAIRIPNRTDAKIEEKQ